MDKKCHIPDDLKPSKREIEDIRKSQRKLAKKLRIYHLSCKEISEVTGLAVQDVRRLV
jgi:hypothetical protein